MDKKRNVGIDLLRILCMAGVCIVHAVGYGWGGHALTEGNYIVSEYTGLHICLLATTTVAVNTYFLMSGYFHSKFRWRKLIEIIVVVLCQDLAQVKMRNLSSS